MSFRSTLKKSSNVEYCAENSLQTLDVGAGRSQEMCRSFLGGGGDAIDTMNRLVSGYEESSGDAKPAAAVGAQKLYMCLLGLLLVGSSSSVLGKLQQQYAFGRLRSDEGQRRWCDDERDTGSASTTLLSSDNGAEGGSCTESGGGHQSRLEECTTDRATSGADSGGASSSAIMESQQLSAAAVGSSSALASEIASLVHSLPDPMLTCLEDVVSAHHVAK